MSVVVIGIGIAAFLFLYLAFSLDNDHWLLKLFTVMLFISLLILLGKAVLDDKDHCSVVPVNATITGTTTSYDYERFCETNQRTTSTIFYNALVFFVIVFVIYLFVYINKEIWKTERMASWLKQIGFRPKNKK